MTTESSCECHRVIYHGRVQGVGFRWTTSRIARQHPVQGYVRNLADGTVELLTQGLPQDLAAFLDHVSQTMSANITHVDQTEESVQDDLSGFSIRR